MEKYEIPDSFDPEWLQMMFRQLAGNIEALQQAGNDLNITSANDLLDDCAQIVDALQQYAGY